MEYRWIRVEYRWRSDVLEPFLVEVVSMAAVCKV